MDAYDEILGLYKARDAKRKQVEAAKKIEETKNQTNNVKVNIEKNKNKPAIKVKSNLKPLSYEELMKKAEMNSKNTLSLTDLNISSNKEPDKRNSTTEPTRRSQPQPQLNNIVNKNMKMGPGTSQKTTKIIKRNMQPKTEISDLVILNQKKRDLRSIEQIQLELKQRGGKGNHVSEVELERRKLDVRNSNTTTKTIANTSTKSIAQTIAETGNKMKKFESEDQDPEKYYAQNYSSIISSMFKYDRNKFAHDDDDTSDMEADYRTVLAEEARSGRLGKEEDLREEMEEIERKKRKKNELIKISKARN